MNKESENDENISRMHCDFQTSIIQKKKIKMEKHRLLFKIPPLHDTSDTNARWYQRSVAGTFLLWSNASKIF